jgi:RNA polymerase-binding transcription factor DksA
MIKRPIPSGSAIRGQIRLLHLAVSGNVLRSTDVRAGEPKARLRASFDVPKARLRHLVDAAPGLRGPWRHEAARRNGDWPDMSKQEMREEAERLIREAMAKKTVTVKQGNTRIEAVCGKCGAPNRVTAQPGETRVAYACKECGHKQKTL